MRQKSEKDMTEHWKIYFLQLRFAIKYIYLTTLALN